MSKKFIKSAIVALALATGVGTVGTITANTSQPVQALSKKKVINSGYYTEVLIDKKIKLKKIHTRHPLYKSYATGHYYIPKNSIVYLKRLGTGFGWYLKTSRHSKTTYTVLKKFKDYSWFELW